jgi:hypothetical protein
MQFCLVLTNIIFAIICRRSLISSFVSRTIIYFRRNLDFQEERNMRNLKVLGTLVFFILAFSISALAQNVNVTATAGTPAATYPTLTAAFTAINAGTHQGAITVDIVASTTEPGSAVLNSSAAAPASYTSVLIRPTVDAVTVAGATVAGRGLIELNGSDNVTIDGDNPNTAGTNRNLTLQNTAANTINYAQVIRIALNITDVASADNNIIRNLNILGNATGRNTSTTTSTTGPENTTYGIYASGSAAGATTAPTAIASVATVIGAGATATNLTIQNNNIQTVARAVAIQGSAATVFPGLLIENNTIGNATAGATDQVYSKGVTAQGTNNAIIRGNTVYVESFLGTAVGGLEFGTISATGTTALFEKNKVLRVRNNNVGTFGAYGINLGGGNTHTVRNNFVADVRNDQTTGTGAFSTTFGAAGIRAGAGNGHIILHNSVHLFGTLPGVTSTDLTAAFMVVANTQTGMDVRNNIFSNQLTGGNPTGTRNVAVYLPSGLTVAMNLTLNNNGYYVGTNANNRLAQVGTTFGTGEYTVANFDPSSTAPATNFRAYTSTLSAAGTNDNASFAISGAPPFVSNTDLHIPAGTATRLESGGAPVGVVDDIDAEVRSATTPDIGADEFAGVLLPANDIAAAAFVTPANGGIFASGASVSPQASFQNVGLAAQTNVTVQFTITGPGGYNYTDTEIIPAINSGQTITVTFGAAPAFTALGTYNMSAQVITADSNTANDTINGTFTVAAPVAGTVTVGTGGTYTSLTNPGGAFQAINTLGATAPIVIEITSNLAGETGAIDLNEVAGGFSVTIRPTGAARTITGTITGDCLVHFVGTDNVLVDGSLAGGTDRSLTVTNTGGGGIMCFSSGANGAQNNIVRNTNFVGGTPTTTLIGLAFQGNTFGSAGADNDNNTIQNNAFRSTIYGVYSVGASAANPNTGVVITFNDFTGTGTARVGRIGIFTGNDSGVQITRNAFDGMVSTEAADTIAIAAGSQAIAETVPATVSQVNAFISGNRIGVVRNNATFSSAGIVLGSGTTGTNTVVNNMISGVSGDANAGDVVAGIYVIPAAGATQNIYYNSVSMTGDRGATANMLPSYALVIGADQPVNLFSNILMNTQTRTGAGGGGQSYAIGYNAATFANLNSNYNDLYVAGPLGVTAITGDLITAAQTTTAGTGTNRVTLADWQTVTGDDANSFAVDPLFMSTTNLHLLPGSPVQNQGNGVVGVLTDFDGDPRPLNSGPEIGADELFQIPSGAPGGTFYNASADGASSLGGNMTITGVLFLAGPFNANGNTLTFGCGATVSGAGPGSFVYGGPVVKQFCAPEAFTFPIGTATNNLTKGADSFGFVGAYSPVTANVTAVGVVPSSLTASVTDSFMAGVDTANSIDRFWTLTETGDITADLTFQYTDNDVNGNEAIYKVLRRAGGITTASQTSTVNTAANTGTVLGVRNFSDWSVGLPLAVAASVDIGGRVTAADGVTGLPKVLVSISGNTLPQPLTIRTNPFGYYNFEELPVGTYVLSVGSKQYTFSVPTRVVTAEDNITSADFTANE